MAMRLGGWIAAMIMMTAGTTSANDGASLFDAAREEATKLPRGGVVIAVQHKGGPARVEAFGELALDPAPTPPQALMFEIGSISKLFTGLLLAQSVIDGAAELSTTLGSLLDEELADADPAVRSITLEQLATHRACLPRLPANLAPTNPTDPYAGYGSAQLYAALATLKLDGTPPCEVDYSNLGYGLLGHLLERLHGESWATLVQRQITGPVGMPDTVQTLDAAQAARFVNGHAGDAEARPWTFDVFAGAGALRSTAADMLAFGAALLDPDHSLAPAWALARELRADVPGLAGKVGLGVFSGSQRNEEYLWHTGGTAGYRSEIRIYPQAQRVEVILINNGSLETGAIYARLDPPPVRQEAQASVPVATERLEALTGLYRIDRQSMFTVLLREDELWVRLTGQPFLPVRHIGSNRFVHDELAAEFRFEHDGSGEADALVLLQHGREVRARRSQETPPRLHFPSRQALEAYVGSYTLAPGAVFTLSINSDTLFAQLSGQPALPVFAVAEDRFEYDIVPAALQFERDGSGQVTALVLHQGGQEQRAVRDDP